MMKCCKVKAPGHGVSIEWVRGDVKVGDIVETRFGGHLKVVQIVKILEEKA